MLAKHATDTLFKSLDRLEYGTVKIVSPNGVERVFQGKQEGHSSTLVLKNWRVLSNLMVNGDVGFAHDYRCGNWETDNLANLLEIALRNAGAIKPMLFGSLLGRIVSRISYMLRRNTLSGSRRNIHAHYDLGNDFYKLWLDPSMTYSSALFKNSNEELKSAQSNKYDRILENLNGTSGDVLEIGCGWGGFAERARSYGDYRIKGITLSQEQKDYAQNRLGDGAHIALQDYRHETGRYDHIVSIEMFEAVGEEYWKTYFDKIRSLLKVSGKAIIQTITIDDDIFENYRRGNDFIRSYIFQGGMLPSAKVFKQIASRSGLVTFNKFTFGQDYAHTLEHWLTAFEAQREHILALGFDESFIRLWRFYLAGCIASFRTNRTNVMQIELAHA